MIPVEIGYQEELPRTERGKVDYRALEKVAIDYVALNKID